MFQDSLYGFLVCKGAGFLSVVKLNDTSEMKGINSVVQPHRLFNEISSACFSITCILWRN